MTAWRKGEKEFEVSITETKNRDGSASYSCRLPKPIIEKLEKPSRIKFVLRGKNVKIIFSKSS